MFYVYKITNLINKKIYIGQTDNFDRRWKQHLKISKNSKSRNFQLIHKAISKYGSENFLKEIIEELIDYKDVLKQEEHWIKFYKSDVNIYGNKFGYNLTKGGEGHSGHKHSNETKNKIRRKALGRKASKATKNLFRQQRKGKGNGMYGKHHANESKKKMSKTKKQNLVSRGENNSKSKLTEQDVRNIKLMLSEGKQQKEIAKIYNIYPSAIQKIASGLNWGYITI